MPFTRLRYHLVTATKGREPLIGPKVEPIVYDSLEEKIEELDGRLFAIGGIEDHIHLVAAVPPTIAVSDFVGRIKAAASGALSKEFAWQRGYGAFTLWPEGLGKITRYVRNQKVHHASDDLREHLEEMDA